MVTLAVNAFKGVKAIFALFGFKMRGVGLEISFATPGEIVVMFGFIEAFIFQAPHILKAVCEGSMTPLPAVLALWDTRIHVHPFNSSNKATNVEASIYKFFGCRSIL